MHLLAQPFPFHVSQVVGRGVAEMLRQLRARGADEEDGAVHPERGAGRAEGPAARRLPAPRQAGRHRALPPGRPLSLPVGRGELVRGEKEQQGGLDAL